MTKKQQEKTTTTDNAVPIETAPVVMDSNILSTDRSRSFVRLDVTLLRERAAAAGKLATIEFVFLRQPLEHSMWGPFEIWRRKGKKAGVRVCGPGRIWADDQQQDHFIPFVRASNPNEDGLPASVRNLALAAYGYAVQVAETKDTDDVISFEPPIEPPIDDSPYVELQMSVLNADEGPEGKLAEASFVFLQPPLEGSSWGSFTIWQRRGKRGGVRVSGPGRTWTDSVQKEHFVPFVRSTNPDLDGLPESVVLHVLAVFEQANTGALPAR